METKIKRKRIKFELAAEPGMEVSVAGTFNDWTPGKHKLVDKEGTGAYGKQVLVPVGRHEYKFVVGEDWQIDPDCDEWTTNEFGSLNNILYVG